MSDELDASIPLFEDDNDWSPQNRTEVVARVKSEINTQTIRKQRPRKLPLSKLEIEDQVFQQRELDYSNHNGTIPYHVDNLLRNLRGEPDNRLDPITVWFSGQRWLILDGHHRHAAYLKYIDEVGETEDNFEVPVEVFEGTFEEAFDVTIQANKKVSEPLTATARSNGAWRRVCLDAAEDGKWVLSKRELTKLVTASASQVGNMRKTYRALSEMELKRFTNDEVISLSSPIDLSWAEALETANGGKAVGDFTPDEQKLKAIEIGKALGRTFGKSLLSDLDTFLLGVGEYSPRLLELLVERVLEDHGVFNEELDTCEDT
ncbi:hypothetical protein BFP76_12370 [Amylibacter kogurei]|uniref:ParB/Sulfiredoxin domain-containing protein n=1 Tax=Paramylibacter kogurei TaxID=1889778 RepID=A0A2G5KDI1_9RHOB|nr:hypothetical protein [Amylibacter kogurei]PIB26674.1 hypothetical protein BFP76_12370 [Amylibacter kogurei]